MGTDARELVHRLQDLLRGVRLIKQRRAEERPVIPLGLVGILSQLDGLADGCHARELALHARLDPSTVSRAVATLVAHGLVERRPDPTDRRAQVLALTPDGRTALTDAHDWYARLLDRALAGWTADEVTALGAGLRRFTRDLEVALENHENLEAAR
ncbi:MarR family winged helix-turn-helix transcriptional regulator [Micromonospora avicenniae]|uniref:Transcriptional regulator, MarR family n=1 Tax=Micromonospora avicenniae TaxID=1198245 RepID=A0A1N6WR84_9ACTN|nr:MarR family transcriptional regulator [Micromonospora avicenniae]SIQ92548.1 transcriptional regulator, MarR family [Micromonospora avicenniae]